jgi:AraC-like DNA-binding protein
MAAEKITAQSSRPSSLFERANLSAASKEDFASAAMVRVLLRGMAVQGLRLPVITENLTQATVALDLKRAVVHAAVEQAGMAVLPLLGQGLHDLAMDPTHLALTSGCSAAALLVRWQRLERFIHSRHRIQLNGLTATSVQVSHTHKHSGPAPLPAEDLVVCGVLCALLEANGLQSVRASASGVEIYPNPDADQILQCVRQEQTGTWQLTWESSQEINIELDLTVSWAQVAPPTWSRFSCAVGDRIAKHLPELLSVDAAASEMEMTRRTFQRTLASESLSYQQIQSEVRFRIAGWHLIQSDIPIAEVGFVCGYSDQAHLTRDFNRRMGMPPARYRNLFAAT